MRPRLDNGSSLDHQDHIGSQDGGETVGDRQGGAVLHQWFKRRLDEPLRTCIERAGRLIQDQDARFLEEDAGNRQALLLAAGELVAALPDDGLVPLSEFHDASMNGGRLSGGNELLVGVLFFLQGFGPGGVIHLFGLVLDLIGFVLFLIFVLVSSVIFLRRENAVPATAG